MNKNNQKRIEKFVVSGLIVFMLILMSYVVLGTDPYFDPAPPPIFNLTQDQEFYYDLNAIDPDNQTPLVYSHNALSEAVNFTSFYMNPETGVMNFSPTNADVGLKEVILSVTDNNSEIDSKLVKFNVTNVNDPPNITGYSPINLSPSIYENNTIGFQFNYNATDPDIPYGDTISNVWIMDGINQTNNNSWTYNPGFCEPRMRNISLIVWDTAGLSDRVEWNVSVINVNRPVQFNWSNPINNITWPEDSSLINNISLDDYFYDLDYSECGDSLNFSVTGNNSIIINISKVTPHNVSFLPPADWFGLEIINFTAYDGYNYSTSNNVLLNVTEQDDPPIINNISNQTAYAYAPFNLQVNASDLDYDTLTYYDNTTLFNINSSTGLISFTPDQNDVGNYSIMINVSDATSNVSTSFHFEIINNSIPTIALIADYVTEESSLFQVSVNGTDSDGDNLTFSTNFTSMTSPTWNNDTAATFSFTPDQSDVGNHSIRVTVYDARGASNYTDFKLTVTDVNNPPILDLIITPQIVKINKSYTMQLNATDPDLDTLNFTHNASPIDFPNFNMSSSGLISFIANDSDLGNHSVNLSVSDITSVPKHDSQVVLFIVTYNRNPVIDSISTQNISEDDTLMLQANATDIDGDPLTYYTNSTMFTISNSGLINFTPNGSQVGTYNILINVTDGDGGWANTTFILNVQDKNDVPYFDPPLQSLSIWDNIYEDTLIEIYVNATDEEGDNLTFSRIFLNGSNLFTIDKIDTNRALINFTPTQSDVGNYSVNFTVSDGTNSSSVVINFTVINVNDAPNIIQIYPYGTPLQNYTVFAWANHTAFPNGTNINASENMNILFNHTSTDPDNSSLNYYWYLDGNSVSTTPYWNYTINFTSSGTHNITLIVSDGNKTDSMYWNLSVKDVNRPPVFGKKIEDDYNDFITGNAFRVNITSKGILELDHNNSYFPSGHYNSSVIDLDMDDGFNYTILSWDASVPSNTNATIETRTSTDSTSWSAWSTTVDMGVLNNAILTSAEYRYIQYRVNLSTTNTNVTPYVSRVTINYDLNDKRIQSNQDVNYGAWIDLDDFFYDPDGISLVYTITGENNVDVRIQNITHFVGLFPSSEGTDTITFKATDSNGNNISSNSFTITVTEATGTGGTVSTSGGTSVIIKTRILEEEKEVETIINLDIITPGTITTYRNLTIVAPITLRNTGKDVLENINLSAHSNNTGLTMEFTKSFFSSLGVDEEVSTHLVITSSKFLGSYSILVKANVQNPKFEDSAKIIISTLEKGELNKTQLYTKITFTRDLLLANPECLELNEMLKDAEKAINESRFADANDQIEKAIRGCRYLLTSKETITENPNAFRRIYDRLFWLTSENRVLTYIIVIIAVFSILILSLVIERVRIKKKIKKKRSTYSRYKPKY